ncbi:MAG: Zn-ribbon domain-containing OB-fold protein, partial [Acidimicrobiia bacterium]
MRVEVVATALGLGDHVPVELHLGGGPAVLDVLTSAASGTLVVGVDPDPPAAAAAALASGSGAGIELVARGEGRLPSRVRAPGEAARVCDDPRLVRDLGWRQALVRIGGSGDGPSVVVGPPPAAVAALGGDRRLAETVGAQG